MGGIEIVKSSKNNIFSIEKGSKVELLSKIELKALRIVIVEIF